MRNPKYLPLALVALLTVTSAFRLGASPPPVVHISHDAYDPADMTVKKGWTVSWINDDSEPHTVTSDDAGGPASGTIGKHETFQYTFKESGTFSYHCLNDSNMKGTVTVTP